MKARRYFLLSCLAVCSVLMLFGAVAAKAETLPEAMIRAYETNPELRAAFERLQSNYYLVPEAKADYRPNAQVRASQTFNRINNDLAINAPGFPDDIRLSTQEYALELSQPLYRGGRTSAAVSEAEKTVLVERALFWQTEQDILLGSVQAYLDLKEGLAIVSLRRKNVAVLQEQLEATKTRFEVGELTVTDLSQAESRLAEALADQVSAEGELAQQRAVYEQFIGPIPGNVLSAEHGGSFESDELLSLTLPETIGEAVGIALNKNPSIFMAHYNQEIAEEAADQVFGELLPEINVVGQVVHTEEPSPTSDASDQASLGISLSLPLYEGGGTRARLRRAKRVINQRQIQIQATERDIQQQTINVWNDLTSARVRSKAIQTQIEAAKIALEGVKEESLVGTRTVLDVLDAEEELLEAKVNLVSAKRDYHASRFELVHALGGLRALSLGLDVSPDWDFVRYKDIEDSWLLFE